VMRRSNGRRGQLAEICWRHAVWAKCAASRRSTQTGESRSTLDDGARGFGSLAARRGQQHRSTSAPRTSRGRLRNTRDADGTVCGVNATLAPATSDSEVPTPMFSSDTVTPPADGQKVRRSNRVSEADLIAGFRVTKPGATRAASDATNGFGENVEREWRRLPRPEDVSGVIVWSSRL